MADGPTSLSAAGILRQKKQQVELFVRSASRFPKKFASAGLTLPKARKPGPSRELERNQKGGQGWDREAAAYA
jgi:hypothetical protein